MKKALLIALVQFFIFFYPVLTNKVFVGNQTTDARSLHYPSRSYLFEKLKSGVFPFWTERIYMGFPVFADLERGYLNVPNVVLTYLLGPWASYKVLHLIHYLFGSMGLYLLLRKKGFGYLSYSVANLIYFFSFYHLLRQQLFNTVLITFLIPLFIYYIDSFISSGKFRYAIYISIINYIWASWGQFNFILICYMIGGLYFCIYAFRKLTTRKVILFTLITAVLSFILCFPVLAPCLELFSSSKRADGGLTYLEGSYPWVSVINGAYPFVWGNTDKFVGENINSSFLMTEFYFYLGISVIIFGLFGLVTTSGKRTLTFYGSLLFLFVLLSFAKYIPLNNLLNFPPINLFRYWGRSAIFLVFTFTLLAASAVNIPKDFKVKLNNLYYLLPSAVLFVIILLTNISNYESVSTIKHIKNMGLLLDRISFISWTTILFLSVLVVCVTIFKKLRVSHFRYIAMVLITVDLTFFGILVFKNNFVETSSLVNSDMLSMLPGKRIINLNDKIIFGNTEMYYPAWGYFGYSGPFESKKYESLIKSIGFSDIRRPKVDGYRNMVSLGIDSGLASIGTYAVIEKNGTSIPISDTKIDLVRNPEVSGNYLLKEEGHIKMLLLTISDIKLDTLIKNYNFWKISVDGNEIKALSTNNDLFLNFNLSKGTHLVELTYIPNAFYVALKLDLVLLVVALFVLCVLIKSNKIRVKEYI